MEKVSIPHAGSFLAGGLHRPQAGPYATVVVAHGLNSSMQSAKLTRLAQALARAGYAALQFDAAGCGQSPGDVAQTSLTTRRDEVLAAADFLAGLWPGLPLAFMGSSLGGAASLLAADLRQPASLILWSTPIDPAGIFSRLKDSGPLDALIRDLPAHDPAAVLARTKGAFFVHGEKDEVVPVEQARAGHRLCGEPKGILILPGADHRLSNLDDQAQAMAQTLAWLEQTMGA